MDKIAEITDTNLYFCKNYETKKITGELWVNGHKCQTWTYEEMTYYMKTLAKATFEE